MPTHWDFFADPNVFLDVAGEHLARDPLDTSVVATQADRVRELLDAGDAVPDAPHWFAVARDGDAVVGVAMRTTPVAPHPLYVAALPDGAAAALVDALAARGERVGGVNGTLPAARAVADRAARLAGGRVVVPMETRLHEVRAVVLPATVPAGSARLATPEDAPLLTRWWLAFHADAELQAGRVPAAGTAEEAAAAGERAAASVVSRIARGSAWVWDVDGEAVHLTSYAGPAYGVARIGPVYTPPQHRSLGYAGALVAHVSQLLLDAGHRVCLFTDRANPASTKVYERIGYERVADTAEHLVV
ncbi:GNAT family N-acetyltransferase [Xylanimonas protaetiae]|uniref:GNAT family N-acetyltransferase n=1 Tax=Xylanimonas protaetiae TaxID=2509457 RepID=A0A4P6F886_9MICO|nr:GNAT family N-acetyltransferase [Xylanimonas protaetiae]QAY70519.1 GNAT family N-acetyltransferase [Xylanimonas protaetiae]